MDNSKGIQLQIEPDFSIDLNNLVKVNVETDMQVLKLTLEHILQTQKKHFQMIRNFTHSPHERPSSSSTTPLALQNLEAPPTPGPPNRAATFNMGGKPKGSIEQMVEEMQILKAKVDKLEEKACQHDDKFMTEHSQLENVQVNFCLLKRQITTDLPEAGEILGRPKSETKTEGDAKIKNLEAKYQRLQNMVNTLSNSFKNMNNDYPEMIPQGHSENEKEEESEYKLEGTGTYVERKQYIKDFKNMKKNIDSVIYKKILNLDDEYKVQLYQLKSDFETFKREMFGTEGSEFEQKIETPKNTDKPAEGQPSGPPGEHGSKHKVGTPRGSFSGAMQSKVRKTIVMTSAMDKNKMNELTGTLEDLALRVDQISDEMKEMNMNALKEKFKEIWKELEKKSTLLDVKKIPPLIDALEEKVNTLQEEFTKGEKEERIKDKVELENQIREVSLRMTTSEVKINSLIKSLKELNEKVAEHANSLFIPSGNQPVIEDSDKKEDKYLEMIDDLSSNVSKMKQQFANLKKEFNQNSLAIDIKIQNKADEESVQELEAKIYQELDKIIGALTKKFSDKMETKKMMKNLETQNKKLQEIIFAQQQMEADDPMFMKRPLGGFSCACCEKEVLMRSSQITTHDLWQKFPYRDPQERMQKVGQGFVNFHKKEGETPKHRDNSKDPKQGDQTPIKVDILNVSQKNQGGVLGSSREIVFEGEIESKDSKFHIPHAYASGGKGSEKKTKKRAGGYGTLSQESSLMDKSQESSTQTKSMAVLPDIKKSKK